MLIAGFAFLVWLGHFVSLADWRQRAASVLEQGGDQRLLSDAPRIGTGAVGACGYRMPGRSEAHLRQRHVLNDFVIRRQIASTPVVSQPCARPWRNYFPLCVYSRSFASKFRIQDNTTSTRGVPE